MLTSKENTNAYAINLGNPRPPSRELKFTLPRKAKSSLLASLGFKCTSDKEHASNTIHSLYFDTDDYLLAMEKASSDYCKTKVRIRWYTTKDKPHADKCWLEIKHKLGSTRNKIRVVINQPPESIINELRKGNNSRQSIATLIKTKIHEHCPKLVELKLKPVFCVSYNRHRFYDPFSASRIACDSDISAEAFQDKASLCSSRVSLDQIILEVKGSEETLPTVLRSFSHQGLKKAAFSKYYECFVKLTGYEQ